MQKLKNNVFGKKMNIIYASSMCSKKTFFSLFCNQIITSGQQVQKYHRILVRGLAEHPETKVTALSKIPLGNGDDIRADVIVRKPNEHYKNLNIYYVSYYRFPYVGNIIQVIESFFKAWLLLKKNEKAYIVTDILNVSMNIGICLACRITGSKLIGIITDLPQMLEESAGLNNFKVRLFNRLSNRIISRCNGYILLTECMNDKINPDRLKPYIVLEGHVDSNMRKRKNSLACKYGKRVCLYSGSLNRIHGIEYMVKGFIKANIRDTELHIYGSGDYEDELRKIAEANPVVRFFGIVTNDQVVEAQIKSTLLINPRLTDQEFVKYSFPSKNMEYMASGTPMLTTRLPGMPREYETYVYFIEKETIEGICEDLTRIMKKTDEELFKFGERAKEFVLKYKTERKQSEKIIQLLKNI